MGHKLAPGDFGETELWNPRKSVTPGHVAAARVTWERNRGTCKHRSGVGPEKSCGCARHETRRCALEVCPWVGAAIRWGARHGR